jgi:hypothetical protein
VYQLAVTVSGFAALIPDFRSAVRRLALVWVYRPVAWGSEGLDAKPCSYGEARAVKATR